MLEVGYREDFLERFLQYFGDHLEEAGFFLEDISYNNSLRELGIEEEQFEEMLIKEYEATGEDLGKIMINVNEDKNIAEIYEIL